MSNIEDLAKQAMDGLDEDVVPKVTKRTSEEVTTFQRLDKDEPKKKAKLDKTVGDDDEKEGKDDKKEVEERKKTEATNLENEQGNQNEGEEDYWYGPPEESCPYYDYRPTYGHDRYYGGYHPRRYPYSPYGRRYYGRRYY